MATLLDPTENKLLKILLYGQPGSTKTRTSATAEWDERTAPALHFDIGGNTLVLRDYKKRPRLIRVDALKDLTVFYNWLKGGQQADNIGRQLIDAFRLTPPYKTVIIDGVTDIQRVVMNNASGQPNIDPGAIPGDMEYRHFNKTLRAMTNFANLFFKLDLNVIVTALERREKVGEDLMYFSPLLLGQSAMEVCGYAYIVGRCMAAERMQIVDRKDLEKAAKAANVPMPRSMVYFNATWTQMAKDQAGLGVPSMADPTITKMLDLIEKNTVASDNMTE